MIATRIQPGRGRRERGEERNNGIRWQRVAEAQARLRAGLYDLPDVVDELVDVLCDGTTSATFRARRGDAPDRPAPASA